ncbi:hypothetical protein K2173_012937 [Erythroxylum novogranatense]|uniref:Uncharacterized protein n=1 Tax=Erythroxylum novogranatense TaxID=1862640 RepID=A0AAV8S5A0_9ROSI|nr:hypothetical protein K2173_012937 [Erythroxylum novogranatense]
MEQRKGRRLVLFPLPFQGHINPMLQLANILHSKGFSITVIHTTFNSPDASQYPHLTFCPIKEDLSESEASISDVVSLLVLLNVRCSDPFRDCLSGLLAEASEEEPVACLISDAGFFFTQGVANRLGLPRFVLRTGGACSFVVFAAFPFLKDKGYLPVQESNLEELVVEFPPLKVKDLPVVDTKKPEELYQLVDRMVNETKASSGIIWNTFQELEESALTKLGKELTTRMYPIGPFHNYCPASSSSLLEQDRSSIAWLNKQEPRSVVYVSFGSMAAISEADFLEIAWGLANSKRPFLWVVRPGLVRSNKWLVKLPDRFLEDLNGRGHIVKWAPQLEVLAHPAVAVFWTHSGWNSTLESICEGVPMMCTPCLVDQKVNARYVSDVWRVGVQVENGLEREKIGMSIRRLMVEKEGDEIRNRILCLKEKASLCLSNSGSSFQCLDQLVSHILSVESIVFHSH